MFPIENDIKKLNKIKKVLISVLCIYFIINLQFMKYKSFKYGEICFTKKLTIIVEKVHRKRF